MRGDQPAMSLTFAVEPVGGLGAELHVRVLLLEVQSAVDLGVIGDKLVALLKLVSADHAHEASDVVDRPKRPHHKLLRQDGLPTTHASHAVQSAIYMGQQLFI